MRILCGMLIALGLLAQSNENYGLPPESLWLLHIKAHVSEQLKRQPNYTCLETVERTQRDRGRKPLVVDTVGTVNSIFWRAELLPY